MGSPVRTAVEGDLHSVQRSVLEKHAAPQFSLRTGSADSHLSLDKWLVALWMIINSKNGISSYEIHRALGCTQKTAWFLLSRGSKQSIS